MVDRKKLGWLLVAGAALTWSCTGGGTTDSGNDVAPTDTGGEAATDVQTDTPIVADAQDVPIVTDAVDVVTDTGPAPVLPGPSHGSAVALTPDDTHAIAVNRAAGSVTVFTTDISGGAITAGATLSLGPANSEPWLAVTAPDNATAYVIERQAQLVAKINGVNGTPTLGPTAATGSEPTGIALSPTGATLYVANWAQGTVTVINTATMAVSSTIDLNATLAASGLLGAGLVARPGIAHPRAIVITNNGDASDADETAYVTEFFAQRVPGSMETPATADTDWEGVVYRIPLSTNTPGAVITLAAFPDTGFMDATGGTTGCFPNQLFDVQVNGGRVYVSSECASPRGPVNVVAPTATTPANTANVKTQVHAAISVIDGTTNMEVHAQSLLLNKAFDTLYGSITGLPDTGAARRMPLMPVSLDFAPNTHVLYVIGYGSDAAFRVAFNADGTVMTNGVGSGATHPFINLVAMDAMGHMHTGQDPIGIGMAHQAGHSGMVVANEFSQNVEVVTFSDQGPVADALSAPIPAAATPENNVRLGRRFFTTGTGRWSLLGQAWNSCGTCHTDGLSDGITWYFGRGPRQTIPLDGTFNKNDPTDARIMNWTAIFDEITDFEGNTRANSGGLGGIVNPDSTPPVASDRILFSGENTALVMGTATMPSRQDGLNGATHALFDATSGVTPQSLRTDWLQIEQYAQTIRSPRGAVQGTGAGFVAAADVTAGATFFTFSHCDACHSGPRFTVSRRFYTPGTALTGAFMGRTINDGMPLALEPALIATALTIPAAFPSVFRPTTDANHTLNLRLAGMGGNFDANNDQITCVLRNVGTFNTSVQANTVLEVRQDMTTAAQGAGGYNIPSLLGAVVGAPYFHAGNARTLEEVLSNTFANHASTLNTNFFTSGTSAADIRHLIAYLTTIDATSATTAVAIPAMVQSGATSFNPVLCPAHFP